MLAELAMPAGSMTSNVIAALPAFDLISIRTKIAKEHPELTGEQLDELESRYLQFLFQCKNEPIAKHEPDKDVDQFWHAHILHTKKYAEDCQEYFGYFLHHLPNALSGEDKCNDGCSPVSV